MGPLLLLQLLLCNWALFNGFRLVQAWPSLDLNELSPPPGNSLQMKVKAYNGTQTFDCVHGKWKLINAEALLVDARNGNKSGNMTTTIVGSYAFQNDGPIPLSTWSLYNSPEEYAESGYPASLVSGTEGARQETEDGGCPNVLLQATSHQYLGRASLVSYVQRFFTKVAELPPESYCKNATSRSNMMEVPFEAEFWIWDQDQVPPADTPRQLQVPEGCRLVEGFFGDGQVPYFFNGSSWIRGPWNALLYNVPGGELVGRHYVNSTNNLVWEVFNPNGWGVSGQSSSEPVQVAENSMAWSLNSVTDNWGNTSLWGPFTHVQMLSTRGGMPPVTASSRSPIGDIFNSTFSAVFWFYA